MNLVCDVTQHIDLSRGSEVSIPVSKTYRLSSAFVAHFAIMHAFHKTVKVNELYHQTVVRIFNFCPRIFHAYASPVLVYHFALFGFRL